MEGKFNTAFLFPATQSLIMVHFYPSVLPLFLRRPWQNFHSDPHSADIVKTQHWHFVVRNRINSVGRLGKSTINPGLLLGWTSIH